MAWIEVHQALRDHRKVLALADALDLPDPHVIGHLVCLWMWSLDNAPDGQITASARTVERAAGWERPAGSFFQGLLDAGFLDGTPEGIVIHDWEEYAGRLIQKRRANAERMRIARGKQDDAQNANVQRTCNARAGATVPNRTVPISETTSPLAAEPAAAGSRQRYPAEFEHFWTEYGPTNGPKKPAHTAWQRLSKADKEAAIAALPAWQASESWRAGYKPYPQKYLNQRQWEADPTASVKQPHGTHGNGKPDPAFVEQLKAEMQALSERRPDPTHPGRRRV